MSEDRPSNVQRSALESLAGLSAEEVTEQRAKYGHNVGLHGTPVFFSVVRTAIGEPMFLLLLVACSVYFVLGEFPEAFSMLTALAFIAGISVYQDFRSQRAVKALRKITARKARVIRSGIARDIPADEIVMHDTISCEEGTIIPADAEIISSNDLALNEAILTGESIPVEKKAGDPILQGTLVVRGYCYARVKGIGSETALSRIGELVARTEKTRTPFQEKVHRFVHLMVIAGSIAFFMVWAYNYWESGSLLHGLLHGLTMAMSVLPEEIPVAVTTFMALGAYRLLHHGIIARNADAVETLGSATVIAFDKTGTLTKNLMQVSHVFDSLTGEEIDFNQSGKWCEVLNYAMWSSEVDPFDPMEKSIHAMYTAFAQVDERPHYRMAREFPLSGTPPVMTHVFEGTLGDLRIACKGAPEGVLRLCRMEGNAKKAVLAKAHAYASRGLRVLGVAAGLLQGGRLPEKQEEIEFTFLGLISFHDPSDPRVAAVVKQLQDAGIEIVMITGDYSETAMAVAKETGIKSEKVLQGADIAAMSDAELVRAIHGVHIFSRITPEDKVRIIKAFKTNGEVIAMTGDGVNDGPALASAHIGVAPGKRGTEVAKSAAGLVLANDDITGMVDAIFLGRRINVNLKQAIRYIISIHIPIILLVTLPIFLGWLPPTLFSPVHVIFLELIMGPTCSIIYENEPSDGLKAPIANRTKHLLQPGELAVTLVQGLVITGASLLAGYFALSPGGSEADVRSQVFATLIISNIFLTLVNRSFTQGILETIRRKNRLIPMIIFISLGLLALVFYTHILNAIFEVRPLSTHELLLGVGLAGAGTLWIEVFKYVRNLKHGKRGINAVG